MAHDTFDVAVRLPMIADTREDANAAATFLLRRCAEVMKQSYEDGHDEWDAEIAETLENAARKRDEKRER